MNLECRQVFRVDPVGQPVEPTPPPTAPRAPAAPPPTQTPSPQAVPASQPKPPPRPAKPTPTRPQDVVEGKLIETRAAASGGSIEEELIVEAKIVRPPVVKEIVWSEDLEGPPSPPRPLTPPSAASIPRPDATPEPDDEAGELLLLPRRRKKTNRAALWLIGMSVTVVTLVGFGAVYWLRQQDRAEELLRQQAEAEYNKGDYAAAAKTFERLVTEYPGSDEASRYSFFKDLCDVQLAVRAVTNRDNPGPAVGRFRAFVAQHQATPHARPVSGYGHDIREAGQKLVEDVLSHARDRLKAYQQARDDPASAQELDQAETSLRTSRELIALLEPFRGPDAPPLDSFRTAADALEASLRWERNRIVVLKQARERLATVTDAIIRAVESDLAAEGYLDDPQAQELLAGAKARLRELVRFVAEEVPPRPVPVEPSPPLLFVSPVGATRRPGASEAGESSVFLALARGILYALDEDTGLLVWAVRVGNDVTDPPAVARVSLAGGPTDLAVVTINSGSESALAGYLLRTGEPRWYQPLPAPPAGPVAVIGTRGYLALRDEWGTIFEFDLATGVRKGYIRIGQPVGPAPVLRPGTGYLYVAADHSRVFVIDGGAKDDDGVPLPPRCVQVLATNHEPGTLRVPPALIGPPGEAPAERWMVFVQTDGPTASKLVVLPLTTPPSPAADQAPPEVPVRPALAPLPVPDWVWFPPAHDGERLALVTDSGQFRLYGLGQPGNLDPPLFRLPEAKLPPPPADTRVRGLALPAEESAYWVLANGTIQKFRLGLVPARGWELLPVGSSDPLGEPTQPPQFNRRGDCVCLVVRSLDSAGHAAVLLNRYDGTIRWHRRLGVVPAAVPVVQDGSIVVVAEDGAVVSLPRAAVGSGQVSVIPAEWVIAPAIPTVIRPTRVALGSNGKTLYTLTPLLDREEGKPVEKWLIRRVSGGRLVHEGTVAAPDNLAGDPVVLGDSLLVPVADGLIYRHVPGSGRSNPDRLVPGPAWVGDRRPAAACSITPVSDTVFFTSDGGKKLTGWNWSPGEQWRSTGVVLELRDRLATAPLALPGRTAGESPRILAADVSGQVALYDGQRGGSPLRRWAPGSGLPAGRPTSSFALQTIADNRTVAAYTVGNRTVICLDPERDGPASMFTPTGEAESHWIEAPQPTGDGRWLVTDRGGRVWVIDHSGRPQATLSLGLSVPAVAVTGIGGDTAWTALSDGSAVVLPLPPVEATASRTTGEK